MRSKQTRLIKFDQVRPSRTDCEDFAALIEDIHMRIVRSTGEPWNLRPGKSLVICCQKLLRVIYSFHEPIYHAALIYLELAGGHYFMEGNKRTAHCTAKAHLLFYGRHLKVKYRSAVHFIEQIADKQKSIAEICAWIEKNSVRYYAKSIETYITSLEKEININERRGRPSTQHHA